MNISGLLCQIGNHGAIYVDSVLEQCTTFILFLPVVMEKQKLECLIGDDLHRDGFQFLFGLTVESQKLFDVIFI